MDRDRRRRGELAIEAAAGAQDNSESDEKRKRLSRLPCPWKDSVPMVVVPPPRALDSTREGSGRIPTLQSLRARRPNGFIRASSAANSRAPGSAAAAAPSGPYRASRHPGAYGGSIPPD